MTAAKEYWEKFLEDYFESKEEVCELNENVGKCMEEYAQLKAEQEAINLLKWLSEKESEYVIMYGGTPGLEKDYRFADLAKEYTAEELFKLYQQSKPA